MILKTNRMVAFSSGKGRTQARPDCTAAGCPVFVKEDSRDLGEEALQRAGHRSAECHIVGQVSGSWPGSFAGIAKILADEGHLLKVRHSRHPGLALQQFCKKGGWGRKI